MVKNIEKKLAKQKAKIKKLKSLNNKLTKTINSAYALLEIIYNENGNPADFKYLDVNPAFEKIFGVLRKDIVGKNISDILQVKLLDLIKIYAGVLKTGTPHEFEYNVNAYIKSFKIKAYKYNKNQIVSIFDDVSDVKYQSNRLLKLSTAIDQSANSIVITDTEGNIEYVNKKFTKTTGYTFLESIGKNPRILNSGSHPVEYYKNLWKTITSGKTWRGIFSNQKKDGSLNWESAIISPVVDENGKTINFLAVTEDITEKRRLESDLIIAKEKAEEADKLKSAFLANVSHEIRTPLNAIIGFSEFLMKDISAKDKKLYGEIIKNSSNDLLNIINDILDIAKIESGHTEIIDEEFSVNQLMTELFEYFNFKKNKLNKEDINIKYEQKLDDVNARIISDKSRVKQVLLNLLENAFKFTSAGVIEFGVNLVEKGKMLEFFVVDSGIGISDEKQELIFERFRQADEGTSRTYGGTGLGLPISKGLARLIGGDLFLKSKEGEGSQFFFQIPYLPVEVKDWAIMTEQKVYNIPKGKKILVVEDVDSNFELVNDILEEYELVIIHAVSGLQAIELYKKNIDTDLILMDIRLPDIDGYEVTNIIKSINPEVPVVALTAYAMTPDKERAFDAGCDDLITKPFKEAKLLHVVEKYL